MLVAAGLGVLLSTAAGCAPALGYFTPPPSTTTLTSGWERWFTLDWTVTPEDSGARRLEGYVISQQGEYAQSVRVLARAVDANGQVLGEEISWIPGGIGGFGRGFFVIARLPAADGYVVSVWDYNILRQPSR
jgi:hypothetical protein